MAIAFLSDEYLKAVEEKLNSNETFQAAAKGQQAALQQEVTGAPGGDMRYWFKLDGGAVEIGRGDLDGAEATISQNYETAVALSKGELNGQAAFMAGKLKITGNMMKLMQLQGVLSAMPAALSELDIQY